MINVITLWHKDLLETIYRDYEYVEYPRMYFDEISEWLYKNSENKEVENIMREIDGCQVIDEGQELNVISRFNKVPLKLCYVSAGSQVVAYIYYLIKIGAVAGKVINITDCGSNAIKYLARHYSKYDVDLYLGHTEILENEKVTLKVNGKYCVDDIYNIYSDML